MWSRLAWSKKQDPISKITRVKRAGDMVQTIERLPSKCEALSSKPQYTHTHTHTTTTTTTTTTKTL
jgi:predicted S18 family serine protease